MDVSRLLRWQLLSTLALLLLCAVSSAPLCVPRDRSALLAFKAGLDDNGNQLGSWTSNGNCCNFKGVICNVKGEVTNLTFEAFVEEECDDGEICTQITNKGGNPTTVNLIGNTLSKLLSLEVLNLTNFFLRDVTPTGLSALKSLKVLGLQQTVLRGPLSADIGKIKSLQYLSLGPGNTEISGPVPASFCALANLQTLILSESASFGGGAKTGSIPGCFNQLRRLEVLDLEGNQFTGRIPASIKQLKKLKVFKVTHNNLTGALPLINSGELPALELLYLESNNFDNAIPPSFGNLASLKELRIGGQDDGSGTGIFTKSKISGSIPATLGNLKKLEVLVIQSTAVTGSIPASLASLPLLSDLELSRNKLSGSIPSNLGASGSLVILALNDNALTGPIPASLGGANKKLFTFNAARNALTGPIPESFTQLKLNELDLSFNQLSGDIPKNLGFAISEELRNLYLNNNQLTGALNPPSLWGVREVVLSHNKLTSLGTGGITGDGTAAQNLQIFDVHSNQLAGPIPLWVLQLSPLTLDVSDNKLTKLPTFDGSKFRPSYANFSVNAITGTIPQAFTLNNDLNILDLHRNQFSGSIPTGFGSGVAGFINVLNFAENQLTGPIPSDIFNGQFTNALIFNKNKLSGPIPQRPPNNDFLNYVDFSDNELTGPFPASIVTGSFFLQKLKLSNNKLTGPIADFTGACPNLQSFIVENNQLTGPIVPAGVDLTSCTALVVYDVSGNRLSGSIPSAVASFTSLEVLDVSNNGITGSVQAFLSNLHALRILDLSTNKLTGGLPLAELVSGFTALKVAGNASNYVAGAPLYLDVFFFPESTFFIRNIQYLFSSTSALDLSGNSITGPIGTSVGQLKGLNFLDLSHNKFSGQVPASIAQITDLDDLDLSSNSLTGQIPSALKAFPASDFAGNPGLCGPPLANKCP